MSVERLGWKYYFLSTILGVLAAGAFPPSYLIFLLVPALTILLLLINTCSSKKEAFLVGWWFGLGHFCAGLYWITYALLTDVSAYIWLIPIAVIAISSVLAVYIGLVTLLTSLVPVSKWHKVIWFAVFWVAIEYLRAFLFTGFPWNLVGNVWTFSLPMAQLAAITGVYGLSLLTIIAASIPFVLFPWNKKVMRDWLPIVVVYGVVIAVYFVGSARLAENETAYHSDVKLKIVQANISQKDKWDPELRLAGLKKWLRLSALEAGDGTTHVIWPETAMTYPLGSDSPWGKVLAPIIPKGGMLFTGAVNANYNQAQPEVWNSLYALNEKGEVAGRYDKHHLVPFGEYVPFREWVPFKKITQGFVDFSSGVGVRTLEYSGLPSFSPLICYEGIFPGEVVDKKNPPRWMLNITNDAWFGTSTGPYQHLNMVRLRAIEQGIPVVRSANTGVSAVIDPFGRIVGHIGLNKEGIININLPKDSGFTSTYSVYGDYIILLLVTALIVFSYFTWKIYPRLLKYT